MDSLFDDQHLQPQPRNNDPDYLSNTLHDLRLEDDRRGAEQTRIHEEMKLEGWIRDHSTSAILVEDAQTRKELLDFRDAATKEELDRVTRQGVDASTTEATTEAPGLESHEDAIARTKEGVDDFTPGDSNVEKADKLAASAEKPTSLESSLAAIRLSPDRQQRLVITGNEDVKRKFYELLAKDGKVFYQGGTPIMAVDRKEAAQYLAQAAERVPGMQVVHSLSVTMDRDKPGFIGAITSGIANRLGRKHEIDSFVVGNEKDIEAGLKDVKDFVTTLQSRHVIPSGDAPRGESLLGSQADTKDSVKDSASADRQPIRLKDVSSLYDLLESPLDKVAAFRAEQESKMASRREFREQREDADIAKAKEKAAEAAAGGQDEKARPPHQRTVELAESFDKHFQTPSVLGTDNGHRQTYAEAIARQAASISDPVKPELASLPVEQRQKFVVQMASLLEKIGDKEFDKGAKKPSLELAGEGAKVRERLTDLVNQEVARDDQFAAKVPALLKELVDNKAITSNQAESIEKKVTEMAAEAAKEKQAASAGAPASAADTGSSTQAASAAAEKAPEVASAEKPAPAPAAPVAEAPAATSPVAQPADTAAPADKPGAEVVTAKPEAPAQSQEVLPAQGKLEAKMAEISALEPGKVSPDQAMSVLAELDAKQTKPLAALGAGEGAASTTTVTRLEGFLEKAEAGDFGSEAAAYAGNLKDALARWKENDLERAQGAGLTAEQHAGQVAQTKAAESAWHDQPVANAAVEKAAPAAEAEKQHTPVAEALAPNPVKEPAAPTPEQLAKEAERMEGVQRLAQTEVAAGKLQLMMENPAGVLTNRDKSWNEREVQNVADKVLALDPDSIKGLSPTMRERTVVNAFWVATSARDGKLPGFDTPEGKEKVQQMLDKVAAIVEKVHDVQASASVLENLKKADAVVDRMAQREKAAELSSVAIREPASARTPDAGSGSDTARAAQNMARDLVHVVYRNGSVSEAQVKHMLKNAGRMTPQTLKGLDPSTRAQAAVALKTLVADVRGGLLGDYSTLSPGIKKLVASAQQSSDILHSALSKDSSMTVEMIKAVEQLKAPAEHLDKSSTQTTKGLDKDPSMAQDGGGRVARGGSSLER